MGSGRWSPATYHDRGAARGGADAFAYSLTAHQRGLLRPHQTLDPSGLEMRESRDSAEHPQSNAIIISLDVTGSMGKVVRGIHTDLPRLHELLLGYRYISDPQILFAAVGDATCDRVPLQVGQFESDNRMDQNLENMILEGGGGGQITESYELMLYIAARHTATDCWEKRHQKGYLFIIGDEQAYQAVKAAEVNRVLGSGLQADLPIAEIVAEASQRYHIYFIIPGGAAHGNDHKIIAFWQQLLGPEHVVQLSAPEETASSIAMIIGVNEGAVSLDGAVAQPHDQAEVPGTIDRISAALARIFHSGAGGSADASARGRDRRL